MNAAKLVRYIQSYSLTLSEVVDLLQNEHPLLNAQTKPVELSVDEDGRTHYSQVFRLDYEEIYFIFRWSIDTDGDVYEWNRLLQVKPVDVSLTSWVSNLG